MAATDWPPQWAYNTVSSSGTTYTVTAPLAIMTGGGGGGSYAVPAPRAQTALEWLDAEIEATCKLARQAA